MGLTGIGCGAVVLLLASGALAQTDPKPAAPLRVEYVAPDTCPTQAEFETALRSRLEQDRARPTHLSRFHCQVEITTEPGGARGQIRFAVRDDEPVVRQVVAPDCRQAVEGIALILALAIEAQSPPNASESPAPAAPEDRSHAPTPKKPTPGVRRPPRPQAGAQREVALGGFAAAASGIAPGLALGLGLTSRLSLDPGWPGLRLSVTAYDTFSVRRADAEVRFQQLFGRAGVCANRPIPSLQLQLDPCLGGEVGMTFARGIEDGSRVVESHRTSDPWLAATLALWLILRVPGAYLELGPELRVPVLRHEYLLSRPEQTVHTTPAVAWGLMAGGGLRL